MAFSKVRQRGFTVMEMLVVIVISGMIVMILLQALSQVMNLHYRFGVELDRNREETMAQSWLRSLIEGLQPDVDDGKHKLQGNSTELSGLSTSVLTEQYGSPAEFSLRIRYNRSKDRTEIEYKDALHQDAPLILWGWQGNQGKFVYIDKKQREYQNWPPELDHSRQLPDLVRVETVRDGQAWILTMKPAGPVNPLPDLRKNLSGLFN
jgi:prepilin-type N-terminal cleavage/methylation domain-containing protein